MAELTRISISLESALLEAFDRSISAKGYPTRSEAIRDLIRDRLIKEEGEHAEGEQVAVVTLVYDHHARELASLGNELLSTKGVLHGDMTFTSGERAFNLWG